VEDRGGEWGKGRIAGEVGGRERVWGVGEGGTMRLVERGERGVGGEMRRGVVGGRGGEGRVGEGEGGVGGGGVGG